MISFTEALRENPLLLSALLAAIASSVVSGIIGSYVVVKRVVFISGSLSHAVFSGIGLSLWLQRVMGFSWPTPLFGALIASFFSALLIGWIRIFYKEREDAAIGVLWTIGMAIGVLFISKTPGFNVELTNFLVGNILWVSSTDLVVLFAADLFTLGAVLCLHRRLLALCFDEEQAALQGLRVNLLYLFLLLLIAITVVLLIQIVGIILVLTMLTIPASIANLFSRRLASMMVIAVVLSSLFSLCGMFLAYHFDFPGGATIALVAGIAYLGALIGRNLLKNGKRGI